MGQPARRASRASNGLPGIDGIRGVDGATGATGPGSGSALYDYTITGSDQASIDTAVDGTTVSDFAGYDVLEVYVTARTADAGYSAVYLMTVNNDTSAAYDQQRLEGSGSTASAVKSAGNNNWTLRALGNGAVALGASYSKITFSNYAVTDFKKSGSQRSDGSLSRPTPMRLLIS